MNKTKKSIVVFLVAAALLISMVGMTSAASSWDFGIDGIAYEWPHTNMPAGGPMNLSMGDSQVWRSEISYEGLAFPFEQWQGRLTTWEDLAGMYTVDIGYCDADGSNFVSNGRTGSQSSYCNVYGASNFYVTANGFIVPQGKYLAFMVTASGASFTVCTYHGCSYVAYPPGPHDPVSIGDFVWNDLNEDGIQDTGEPGISNVIVKLHNRVGDLVATTTTDGSGYYRFDVAPGKYYLVFEAPKGYCFSPKDQGSDDTIDSDASTTTGRTDDITLTVNPINPIWDAGIHQCGPPPGTGTPGYWKNHPEAWPVEEITIGGVTYTKDEAIANMGKPEKGDKTYTLFRALVAAKLNKYIGNDVSCIKDTIEKADAWMAEHPIGSKVKAGGKKSPWRDGEPLYLMLDEYNNGFLCAPSRG